jgi:hypothetical protein
MNTDGLKVIGAGFGRTGTESLKMALEQLGFGKCYHAFEILPEHLPEWKKLQRGETPDYNLLFKGYQSCTDFPAAFYYRELMKQYPNSKVILTTRDPQKWYDSASKTIFRKIPNFILSLIRFIGFFSNTARAFPDIHIQIRDLVHDDVFKGRANDREYAIATFKAWNEEVMRTVPAERLMVFEVKDGWEPLCKFLNVPIPATPFPHSNAGASFDTKLAKRIVIDTDKK